MEISFKQTIFSLDSKNKKCNDCGEDDVKFVSVNNGVTLCELCAQIHKNFGNQISYIKSIDDEFDDYLMNYFIYGGNKKFRKNLRQMGVNLDVKKAQLYKTFGADYYRRNLKSIVKGNSQLEKDFDNPNEIMQIQSNAFPEFENYVLNSYNNNQQNLSILNNLNIDLGGNSNFDIAYINNQNQINTPNNNINIAQNNNIESVKNEPEKEQPKSENNEKGDNTNNDTNTNTTNKKNINFKNVMQSSLKNMKNFGNFMKKESIKGYGLMKKYGKIVADKSKPTIQNATKYVKNHVPGLKKKKQNSEENENKEVERSQDI